MEPSECLDEKHATNPPFRCANYLIFCTGKNKVIKITCFSSEMVLQTTKHTMIYPGSGPLLKDNSPTSSCLIWKMNRGYNGVSRELKKFAW
jgi:hypothetical protein